MLHPIWASARRSQRLGVTQQLGAEITYMLLQSQNLTHRLGGLDDRECPSEWFGFITTWYPLDSQTYAWHSWALSMRVQEKKVKVAWTFLALLRKSSSITSTSL